MSVRFDEPNLVPSAGLLPAAVLAQRVGLSGLVEARVTLARHGANGGAKALTVIGSMLAGGDSIDDTALLRAGALPALPGRIQEHNFVDLSVNPAPTQPALSEHVWSNANRGRLEHLRHDKRVREGESLVTDIAVFLGEVGQANGAAQAPSTLRVS